MTQAAQTTDRIMRFLETPNGQRIAIAVFSVFATLVLVAFPGGYAAFAIGLPYMFFVPGFAVVRMFFWKGTSMEAKFVLSLGLSILVVIFLGLILVLTPIGLDSNTTRGSLILFALGAVALEMVLSRTDRFGGKEAPERTVREAKIEPLKLDKVVAAMLGTALAVSAVSLGLIITADYPSTTFIAITDTDGMAFTNTTFAQGSNITVMVEMKNGEDGPRDFSLAAHAWNTTLFGVQYFSDTLEEGEKWFVNVTFELNDPGVWRLDFDLYILEDGGTEYLYGSPHLWILVE